MKLTGSYDPGVAQPGRILSRQAQSLPKDPGFVTAPRMGGVQAVIRDLREADNRHRAVRKTISHASSQIAVVGV